MEEFFNSLGNARDKARRNHYKCLCSSCNKNAINSHIIQQHPYLESIAEKGLLYQIKDNEINPRSGDFSDNKEQFLSLRQVLSMPLFCSEHDNQLFKPIESGEIDFDSALTFLLFSFRGLSSQRYFEEKRQILYQNTGFEGEPFDVQREYSQHVIERFDCTELFKTTKQNVSLHINNIFREGELMSDSVVKESLTTAGDGKNYRTKYYNLDVIET